MNLSWAVLLGLIPLSQVSIQFLRRQSSSKVRESLISQVTSLLLNKITCVVVLLAPNWSFLAHLVPLSLKLVSSTSDLKTTFTLLDLRLLLVFLLSHLTQMVMVRTHRLLIRLICLLHLPSSHSSSREFLPQHSRTSFSMTSVLRLSTRPNFMMPNLLTTRTSSTLSVFVTRKSVMTL